MDESAKEVKLILKNGWRIVYLKFMDVEPDDAALPSETVPFGDTLWSWVFTEDILQIKNKDGDKLIDLGWYPDGDPSGQFRLILVLNKYEGFDWQHPIEELISRSKQEVINKIHDLTNRYN